MPPKPRRPNSWFMRTSKPLVDLIDDDKGDYADNRETTLTAMADLLVLGGINDAKRHLRQVPFRSKVKEVVAHIANEMEKDYAYTVWRAMCYTIRYAKEPIKHDVDVVNWSKGNRHYDVDYLDTLFVWKYLSTRARKSLISFALDVRVVLRPMAKTHVKEMIEQLTKYAYYLVNRKLKFIWNNDAGTPREELADELIAKGAEAMRKMEFTGNDNGRRHNRLHILNYAHRAVHNRAMGLIEHHTSTTRAAVVRVFDGEPGKSLSQFERRTLSMDMQMSSSNPDSEHAASFHGILESSHGPKRITEEVFINEVRSKFKGVVSKILSILMDGYTHDGFEEYLQERYKSKRTGLSYEIILREACDYFGVNFKLLRRTLRTMLQEGDGKHFEKSVVTLHSAEAVD